MSDAPEPEIPPADARLLADLRRVLDTEPAPAGLVERAEGLVAYMDVDRDLAALLEESGELAGIRGSGAQSDRLEFETADGTMSVEVVVGRDRLTGQVLTGVLTEVILERLAAGDTAVTVDELGRFVFDSPAPGPVRLRWVGSTTRSATSDWFLL